MRDTNNLTIVGRLVKNASVTISSSGTAIGNIVIASNTSKKTSEGWQDVTNYFDVTFFGSMAKNLQQYLLKGKQVCITGELHQDRWQDNDGKKYYSVYILAANVQLLGGSGKNNNEAAAPSSSTPLPPVNQAPTQAAAPAQVQAVQGLFGNNKEIIF